jgi:biotin carboxyl carrier protein
MVYEVVLGKEHYAIEVDDKMVGIANVMEDSMRNCADNQEETGDDLPDFVFDCDSNKEQILSPMQGRIIAIHVTESQRLKKNDIVVTLESMKMEINVIAQEDGVVEKVLVREGNTVKNQEVLMNITNN